MSALVLLALTAAPVQAQTAAEARALPEAVRAMVVAAIDSGDPKAVEIVLRLARQTHGGAGTELDSLQQLWDARNSERAREKEEERRTRLANAALLDNWKGQVELGASRSTGRSDMLGLYSSLGLDREGLRWRHKLIARAEIQRSEGVQSTERAIASWQPNYRFDGQLYAYGLGQFEHDPLQGYDARYTLGGGLGYGLVASERARIDIEGGPALRHTDSVSGFASTSVAARASLNLSWQVSPTLQLRQTSAVYYEQDERSANALTSLDATLFGPLKARLSYDLRYEDRGPGASLDTLSRATLVYSF
jgi:putative salt-induced outer membrane protein